MDVLFVNAGNQFFDNALKIKYKVIVHILRVYACEINVSERKRCTGFNS